MTKDIPLRARIEGGGTPKMKGRFEIKSETGRLRDVLLGPAESFRWMGLENAAWSSLVRDTLRKGYKFEQMRWTESDYGVPPNTYISAESNSSGDDDDE